MGKGTHESFLHALVFPLPQRGRFFTSTKLLREVKNTNSCKSGQGSMWKAQKQCILEGLLAVQSPWFTRKQASHSLWLLPSFYGGQSKSLINEAAWFKFCIKNPSLSFDNHMPTLRLQKHSHVTTLPVSSLEKQMRSYCITSQWSRARRGLLEQQEL